MKNLRVLLVIFLLVIGLAMNAAAQADSSLERAQALQRSGHIDQAIQAYHELLQQESQNVEALSALSGLLESQGRWREAVPLLETLVVLQPHDSAALYRLGRMKSWQSTEKNDEAVTLLGKACAISDHNPE